MSNITSFHNITDQNIRAHQTFTGVTWVGGTTITTRNRTLSYQFFPHFHPYVTPLMQRLNEGGVAELQDSDTLYLPQPNPPTGQPLQPLTVIPNSSRALLLAGVAGTRPDGTNVSLDAGTPLTLNDGTTVQIPSGTTVLHPDGSTSNLTAVETPILPGNIPVTASSGIQWPLEGADSIVPDNTAVVLPNSSQAVLTADGTAVTLPAGTQVALRSGLPRPYFYEEFFSRYGPDPTWVQHPYPVKDLDFTYNGAYSIYNWELFFHAPLLIAIHLSQNQKFQDAQSWFHYIFNPMDNSPGPTPERFWKVKPFQYTDVTMIAQILTNLSTQQDMGLWTETMQSIQDWKQNPFQPFEVAKYRPTAYMLKTVMAYLDNLIAWGDSLFQQYTIETINEATQIYVMAAHILGPKPQPVPEKASTKPLTFNDIRGNLDAFSNAMVDIEVDIPFDTAPLPGPPSNPQGSQIIGSIGQSLYFCVPRNDILLGYWDTVADRLFKIHNSLNLQGVFQQLPLYDPPIDPALLVRAAAAGLDVSAVVNGLNQPLPLVRFEFLLSKAAEICQEVKSLGANILAAIEKQDNESLALLRAQHENAILGLAYSVKYSQWQEAIKSRQALEQSLFNALQRYTYYETLLGRSASDIQSSIPSPIKVTGTAAQLDGVDQAGLSSLNFTQGDETSEPQMSMYGFNPDISTDSTTVSDGGITTMSKHEVEELNDMENARDAQVSASTIDAMGSELSLIPQFNANLEPMGCGASVGFGGVQLHAMASALAAVQRASGEEASFEASKAGKLGSYSRRQLDWQFQSNVAKGEMNQISKQLRAAEIHEALAQNEFNNHKTQMDQAQEIVDFLQGNDSSTGDYLIKETTVGFYAYMKREVKALYAKSFQLAFEVAKKAERALQNELGDPTLSYIQFNYLDGTEGLLAGEKLLFDLKTMEMAYHDLNQREYEMTKHVSLLQVDPLALIQLRATGSCTFMIPEEAFDIDIPLVFRRCKSLAISLPCTAGPYTSVNCSLLLQKGAIRTSTDVAGGYARKGSDDPRFSDYYGSVQAIVTSSAQSDSGLFETNLAERRYLPFEHIGVAGSQWQLSIPADVRQFDFETIADVVLHIRYTAREPGEAFKAAATQNLQALINKAETVGSVRLFSVRHEFPSEWAKFQNVTIGGATATAGLSLSFLPEHYPFWAQALVAKGNVKGVEFFAQMQDSTTIVNMNDKPDLTGNNDTLSLNPQYGNLLTGGLAKIALPLAVSDPTKPFTIYFDRNAMQDLWLAVTWGKS